MKSSGPFGDQSSIESLKWLSQFKKLDAKRRAGLSAEEEKVYQSLLQKLGAILEGKTLKSGEQKRKTLRLAKNLNLQFHSGAALKKAMVQNISGGGLYIATRDFLPIGAKLELKIEISDLSQTLDLPALVSWVNPKGIEQLPPGMGLRFDSLTKDQEEKLQRILHGALDERIGPR